MNKTQKWAITSTCCVIALAFTASGVDQIVAGSPSTASSDNYNGFAPTYSVPFPSFPVAEYAPTVATGATFQCVADGEKYVEQIQPLNYASATNLHTFTNDQSCENQAALDQWSTS